MLVLGELVTNLRSGFNCLALRSNSAKRNGILVDITACAATIAIRNFPTVTVQLLRVIRRLVDTMALLLLSWKLVGKYPSIYILAFGGQWNERSATYRSADPVSMSRFIFVPPTSTGVRYMMSYSRGVVTAVP